MKKIITAIVMSLILVFAATSCAATPSSISSAVAPEYKNDDLKALCKDLKDKELIPETATKLEADYIGAEEGYRFTAVNPYGTVEFYYFKNQDSEAYKSAQKDNTVTLFGTKYKAYVSSSGKFMMVFSDSVEIPKASDADTSSNSSDNKDKKYDLLTEFSAH